MSAHIWRSIVRPVDGHWWECDRCGLTVGWSTPDKVKATRLFDEAVRTGVYKAQCRRGEWYDARDIRRRSDARLTCRLTRRWPGWVHG